MRPLRVRAEGFSVYRQPVELDLEGVDFFSLTGATGAGKSSLIDAMVFALYGRVPRLGGNTVAPAISAGADRARVAFDFDAGGSRYVAVRVAQRTKTGGASVREARLQQGEKVIAEGADDVTGAVEDLLKLRFEDFTRTVVLPQGEFARFLTATKSDRQALLRNLLGLDLYTRVRSLAKTRVAVATERVNVANQGLEALEVPDDEAIAAAEKSVKRLEELAGTIAEGEKQLSDLDGAVLASAAAAERVDDAFGRLESIQPPAQLEELEQLTLDARDQVGAADEEVKFAESAISDTEKSLSDLPSRETLATQEKLLDELAQLESQESVDDLTGAKADLDSAERTLVEAASSLEEARVILEEARATHAAHAIAGTLVIGEPCPVCRHEVEALPEPTGVLGLDTAVAAETDRREAHVRARTHADEQRSRVAGLEAAHKAQQDQATRLRQALSDAPDRDEIANLQIEHGRLDQLLTQQQEELAKARQAQRSATRALDDLAEASRRVDKELTTAQLGVADLKPPVSEADDVVVKWKDLIAWRDETLTGLRHEQKEAQKAAAEAALAAERFRSALVGDLADAGIEPVEPFSAGVASALERARNTVASHEKTASQAAELEAEIADWTVKTDVANALANHLRADGFEQWLMAGALADLVDGANGLLADLSEGGYSLDADESGSFAIVDHRNADEVRSVSTLSGGETFLVSLALALSLAEALASGGGAHLDTIILDEGFGTLDEESLDTVASVLEELTGEGLTVGIITHVKELAARAPNRFEVTRHPEGSTVAVVS